MAKSFSLFLARRYLKPRGAFVWVIHAISILGVVLGVAILIVVLAVMKGFELTLKDTLLSFQPHLYLLRSVPVEGESVDPPVPYREVQKMAEAQPAVIATSPFVAGPVILIVRREGVVRQTDALFMRGLREDDPQLKQLTQPQANVSGGQGLLVAGQANLASFTRANPDGSAAKLDRVIITRSIAKRLKLDVGDEISLYSLFHLQRFVTASKQAQERDPEARLLDVEQEVKHTFARPCAIAGIVTSPMNQDHIIVPLDLAQDFFDQRGPAPGADSVHGIGVLLRDPYILQPTLGALRQQLPPEWRVMSWIEANESQFELISSQTDMVMVLVFLVTVVAGFCVINTIIVTTVQKRREIGIMKAIGAGVGQVVRVFVSQGAIVGTIGTVCGVALGLAILPCLNPFRDWLSRRGFDPFPEELYKVSLIPTRLEAGDVVTIAITAVAVCTLAAFLPAWVAAKQDAAKALRND